MNLLLALSKADAWLVEGENRVYFEANLALKLLSALTSLSCFVSMWWGHLNHSYGKQSPRSVSLMDVWAEGGSASAAGAVSRLQLGPTTAAAGVGHSCPTTIPGQKQSLKGWRGGTRWKPACSIWLCLLLLTQVDARPEAPGSHLVSRCLLFTFSKLNICSCMQRRNNML